MADWSRLPKELLDLIAEHLDTTFDHLRFRFVCSAWRAAVTTKLHRLQGRCQFLPNDSNTDCFSNASFGFYLSKRTVFLIRSPQTGIQADSIRRSWVVKIEEDAPNRKHLVNPLKRHRFGFAKVLDIENLSISEIGQEYVISYKNFPVNSTLSNEACNLYMEKVVLMYLDNCERDSDYFVLLTIHVSGRLAMFKSGDKKWTILEEMPSPYDDVISYKGKFFAVDNTGRTVFVDHLGCSMSMVANPVFGGDKKYLVECKGDLLLVDMYLSFDTVDSSFLNEFLEHEPQLACCMSERTVMFKVFKFDEERKEWVEVKNLSDFVLFLGEDCVFSASVDDLCVNRGNCILFVDNFFDTCVGGEDADIYDVGVFDLESGCIKPLQNYPDFSKLFWPPPHWITSAVLEV